MSRDYRRPRRKPPKKVRSPECHGKVRYKTEQLASTALKTIQEQSERTRKAVRVYPCGRCAGWHLTSQRLRSEADIDEWA